MTADRISVEEELTLRLCGVATTRAQENVRIRSLAGQADADALLRLLNRQRLLTLVGSRLIEACDDMVAPRVRVALDAAIRESQHRHTLNLHMTRVFCERLERAGIEVVALKGPLLAERIYADPALRASPADLDFLVRPERLDEAVGVFTTMGYTLHDGTVWADGLPHYHYGLSPGRPGLPKVELHWRIHWYEKAFAPRLIARARRDGDGLRVPSRVDDLAALLIIFARDGFVGLRLAADIGAWWDALGETLGPLALDAILTENPRLRATLLTAVATADTLVGLPGDRLASGRWPRSRRARLAPRLLNWRQRGATHEVAINITLIDLLLTPPGALSVFLRHYYLQPLPKLAQEYGWRPEDRLRNHIRRLAHAAVRITRSSWAYTRRLWAIRHGSLDALPPRTAPGRPA